MKKLFSKYFMGLIIVCTIMTCGCSRSEDSIEQIEPSEYAVEKTTENDANSNESKQLAEVEKTEVEETEIIEISEIESNAVTMNKLMYAMKSVNVRKGPSTDYEKIGSLKTNEEVTVIGKADTGWYEIMYNGKTAYVSDNFLSDDKVEVVTSGNINSASSSNMDNTLEDSDYYIVSYDIDTSVPDWEPGMPTPYDGPDEYEEEHKDNEEEENVDPVRQYIEERAWIPGHTYVRYYSFGMGGHSIYTKEICYVVSEDEYEIIESETISKEEYYEANSAYYQAVDDYIARGDYSESLDDYLASRGFR